MPRYRKFYRARDPREAQDKPPVEHYRRRIGCQCGGSVFGYRTKACDECRAEQQRFWDRFMGRRDRDRDIDPETLEREGWPAQDEERAAEVAERADQTRRRNRQRQGKDSR